LKVVEIKTYRLPEQKESFKITSFIKSVSYLKKTVSKNMAGFDTFEQRKTGIGKVLRKPDHKNEFQPVFIKSCR
ncbi:MAG: hypothetical protein GY749_05200, partial [Desulfobacteraceae bacterium]|nr:hypothetical protein [Desulfobacteraceae bacterium]